MSRFRTLPRVGSGLTQSAALVASAKMPEPAEAAPPEADTPDAKEVDVLTADRTGSDVMADILKSLNFEYVASNPGSSFRALHESIINYGGNRMPELITCCHEES